MAQSGISPSNSTLNSFKEYLLSPQTPLIIHINDELSLDASQYQLNNINHSNAHYIISSDNYNANKHVFVSYIPDTTPVREKMLYASTRNALLRGLGTDHFSQILFSNDENDLINWDQFIKPVKSNEIANSEDEENLIDKPIHTSSNARLVNDNNSKLLFSIPDEIRETLKSNIQTENLLQHITFDNENIQLNSSSNCSIDNIQSFLSTDSPSYYIYNNFFILSCPSGSNIRQRMFLAANKNAFVNYLTKLGYTFTKNIEIGDPDELILEDEVETKKPTPTDNRSLRFNKPKGPKRR